MPALRGQAGAIDLASIMVGTIVISVVAGTIAATVFAVIPWAQDNAAKAELSSVRTAESAAFAFGAENGKGKFYAGQELIDQGFLQGEKTLAIGGSGGGAGRFGASVRAATPATDDTGTQTVTNSDGSCYVSSIQSESGKVFWTDSSSPSIGVTYAWAAAPQTACVDAVSNETVFPTTANVGVERALFTASDGTETFMYSYSEDGVTTKEASVAANFNGFSTSEMFRGNLYFTADGLDGVGKQIWEYDGVDSKIVKQFSPIYDPFELEMANEMGDNSMLMDMSRLNLLTVFQDKLMFQASDEATGDELWAFDGETFELVADINAGSAGSNIGQAVEFNGLLYVNAMLSDGTQNLWTYDGSTVEAAALPGIDQQVDGLTVYDAKLYYTAGGTIHVYDGTSSTTLGLTSYKSTPFKVVGDLLYVAASDGTYTYSETAGLTLVSSINLTGTTLVGGSFYGAMSTGSAGNELVRYGSSFAESTLVADINPGSAPSNPDFTRSLMLGDTVLFPASSSVSGYELWSFDGTTATLTSDINVGSGNSSPTPIGTFE